MGNELSGRMITVEFIGHSGGIVTEHNGKKYSFSRKHPIKTIPIEVYDLIRDTGGYLKTEITVVGEQNDAPKAEPAKENVPGQPTKGVDDFKKYINKPKEGPKKRTKRSKK